MTNQMTPFAQIHRVPHLERAKQKRGLGRSFPIPSQDTLHLMRMNMGEAGKGNSDAVKIKHDVSCEKNIEKVKLSGTEKNIKNGKPKEEHEVL